MSSPVAVLAAAFLFNLGQGVLRPALPLYLQEVFGATYREVTQIPVVFGAGKWIASLPAGYLLGRVGGRPLLVAGLLTLAAVDLASAVTPSYVTFLGLRGLGGMGWAMFGTVALATMVARPGDGRRGQAVSLLLFSESLGLLLGSTAGGLLYANTGIASPFILEAACMVVAAAIVAGAVAPPATGSGPPVAGRPRALLSSVLAVPGVRSMSLISGVLMAIQTGLMVFLFPLHLTDHARLGPEAVGVLVGLTVLGRLLALGLGGGLSDRWGRTSVLVPGLFGYAVLLGGLGILGHPVALGCCSLLAGATAGVVVPVPAAVIGDRLPGPLQGVAIGWLRTVTDAGMIVGPLVFGALADAVHLVAAFLVGGALVAVVGGWTWRSLTLETRARDRTRER